MTLRIMPAYTLLSVTLSGAHLYGFPSPDSDYDLRDVYLLPLCDVVGLYTKHETIERSDLYDGLPIDLVTHDAKKNFSFSSTRTAMCWSKCTRRWWCIPPQSIRSCRRLPKGA